MPVKKLIMFSVVVAIAHGTAVADPGPKAAVPIAHNDWITSNDYPQEAKDIHAQGAVRYQIDISPKGLPENCVIMQSSGFDVLDQATCRIILQRARFTPALNREGEPAEGGYRDRVVWKLP
jgi:TonB family protein